METKTVDIKEAQIHLKELLSLVNAGTEVVLTEEENPVARIVCINESSTARTAGLHEGAMKASGDFDKPLSDEYWAGEK